MALTANTKLANRYGLNLTFHKIGETGTDNDVVVDFANEVSIEITGDAVYATGGQGHKRLVGFNDPIEGTMSISTQIVTDKLLKLVANDSSATVGTTTFKSTGTASFYKITGTTVWKDTDGATYAETISVHKALIRPNYNVTYSGEGDPQSIDINIDLMEDETEGMITLAQV